jgi:hypothetical protein
MGQIKHVYIYIYSNIASVWVHLHLVSGSLSLAANFGYLVKLKWDYIFFRSLAKANRINLIINIGCNYSDTKEILTPCYWKFDNLRYFESRNDMVHCTGETQLESVALCVLTCFWQSTFKQSIWKTLLLETLQQYEFVVYDMKRREQQELIESILCKRETFTLYPKFIQLCIAISWACVISLFQASNLKNN